MEKLDWKYKAFITGLIAGAIVVGASWLAGAVEKRFNVNIPALGR